MKTFLAKSTPNCEPNISFFFKNRDFIPVFFRRYGDNKIRRIVLGVNNEE